MAMATIGNSISIKEDLSDILHDEFKKNLKAQSGDYNHFIELTQKVEAAHRYNIHAADSGFLKINLNIIRDSICQTQNDNIETSTFPDPCGIILKTPNSCYVNKGDTIATFRCVDSLKESFYNSVLKAFLVDNLYINPCKIFEIR
jgi:thymidine phosphorylase